MYVSHRLALALAASLLAFAGHAIAADAAPPSGKFTTSAGVSNVADGIAFRKWNGNIAVVFSDQALDRKSFADDGKLNWNDFRMRPRGATLELDVDAEGKIHNDRISTYASSDSMQSSGHVDAQNVKLVLDARTNDRIAGRLLLANKEEVRFDLPVHDEDNYVYASPTAKPLPADGGEPGRALLALTKALESGDMEAIIAQSMPPEQAPAMRAQVAEQGEDKFLSMMRLMRPVRAQVKGGSVDGDSAVVDFSGGMADGSAVAGKAEMKRLEGRWFVTGIKTRQ